MLSKFQIFIDIGKFILIKISPKWAEARDPLADEKNCVLLSKYSVQAQEQKRIIFFVIQNL